MRRTMTLLVCIGFLLPTVVARAAEKPVFKYELVSSVSPAELWHSTQRSILGGVASIIYFDFDREDAPKKDGWTAQGLVLGGLGDLDSKPIAIRLWSKMPSHLDINASKELSVQKNAAVALFETEASNCGRKTVCPAQRFQFSVTGDGKVLVDDKLIGSVE